MLLFFKWNNLKINIGSSSFHSPQDVARLIAECYANPDKQDISFLVVEAKKSNLEPKPTALIFLEA